MYSRIKYAFLKNRLATPIYLIFFITNQCNSKCRHCFFHKKLNSSEKELSLKEIETFAKDIGKLVWLGYSGGEPFLRQDLYETYKIFAQYNQLEHIALPTNGILTEKISADVLKILADDRFHTLTINLSLEGTKDVHDLTRGVTCYENVLRTYEALARLKSSYKKLNIMLATVLTRQNYSMLSDFHKEVVKIMPHVDYHNFEIARGTPFDDKYGPPTTIQLRGIRDDLIAIWGYYDYYADFLKARIARKAKKLLYDQSVRILETGKQPWPCLAGRVHAVIDYKGDVAVCEFLPTIGNVREQPFKEIWHSPQAQITRASIKHGECACHHACFQTTSMLFNQRYWPRLVI